SAADETAGSVVLTLTANGNGSCLAVNDNMTLTINPIPLTSNISGNATPNCLALGETYSVALTPGSKYYWSVPESAVITTDTSGIEKNSIVVNFDSISDYIRVYEISQYGCLGSEVSLLIDLQGCNLDADFIVDDDNICIEETITFTNTSGGISGSTMYSWNFGDGAVPQTANTIGPHEVYYLTQGNKTISLTITQGLSDNEIKADFITVNPSPVATIDPAERCGEGEVTLNAAVTNGDIIEFSLDGGTSIDFTDDTAPYQFTTSINENTTIEVWARAVNSITQCTGDWINSATATSYPVPVTGDIIPDEPSGDENYIDIVCSGDHNISYSVAEVEGSTFNWAIPALSFTAENSQQITVYWNITGGEYIISVQEISEYGCEGIIREETVLVSEPEASLDGDKEICEGESVTVTTTTEFSRYLWYNGSTNQDITVSDEGLISVIVWDEYDCISRDSVNVYVYELPDVELGNDTVICGDSPVQVDAGDFDAYIWSTGHTSNPIIIYEGEKTVSVTVTNEYGCTGSDSFYVNSCIEERLFDDITNAFTPNDDGVHDVWIINNISLFPDAKIEVFDRWGRLVFSKDGGYENDWDGTYNGKDLPMDTYYYVIDLKTGTEPLKGTLTIIR
ncbi:MAG: gliding motility-associated C-terminal domain-containing protein, partial [Bacteroidales bacterium]